MGFGWESDEERRARVDLEKRRQRDDLRAKRNAQSRRERADRKRERNGLLADLIDQEEERLLEANSPEAKKAQLANLQRSSSLLNSTLGYQYSNSGLPSQISGQQMGNIARDAHLSPSERLKANNSESKGLNPATEFANSLKLKRPW